jgi:UDP-perosamine 4-acetyltransferase
VVHAVFVAPLKLDMNPSLIPILIVGAGGHAKVVIEILRELGKWNIVGLTDQDPTPRRLAGADVLGSDDAVLGPLRSQGVGHAIVAVGDNLRRQQLGRRVRAEGFALANAISPAAQVSASARIGAGVAIVAGAVINAEAVIGDCVIINTLAGVDHDCVLGEAVHVAPGVVLAGRVRVGARTLIGAGASAIPGVTIGSDVVVGSGAAVIDNIPDGVTAVGVPACWRQPERLRKI